MDAQPLKAALVQALGGQRFRAGDGVLLTCAAGFLEVVPVPLDSPAAGSGPARCELRLRLEAFGTPAAADPWCVERAKETCAEVLSGQGEPSERAAAALHLSRLQSPAVPFGATAGVRVRLRREETARGSRPKAISRTTVRMRRATPSMLPPALEVGSADDVIERVTDDWGRARFDTVDADALVVIELDAGGASLY